MRRRKAAVVWLPLDINNRLGVAEDDPATSGGDPSWLIGSQDVPAFSIPVTKTVNLFPLVKDEPQDLTAATSSLSDLEGSAYRLRRVVGKVFVSANGQFPGDPNLDPTQFLTTVGLIVLRVNPSGAALQTAETYDIAALDAVSDPWIWRRSWAIGINGGRGLVAPGATDQPFTPAFPSSNIYCGSALDGPHIDAKTARVISDEERLFLVWSTIAINGAGEQQSSQIFLFADLRVLGTMRKQSGNRRNASR